MLQSDPVTHLYRLLIGALLTLDPLASGAETLLVADGVTHQLVFLDTDSGRIIQSVRVAEGAHEVVVTRDGRLAIVASPGSNAVTIVDIATGAERKRLVSDLFGFPHGLAVHPDGKTVYVTSEEKQLLLAIDVESLEITKQLATGMEGSHMVVLSPDGSRAYISDRGSARVTVVDTERWAVVTHMPAGDGVEGIGLTPDGQLLIAANRNENSVHFIDTETLKPVGTLEVGDGPVRVACSPDNRLALVSHRASGDVYVIDLDTRTVSARIPIGIGAGGMAFSDDGRKAFVSSANTGLVSVVDLETMKVTAAHKTGKRPDGMTRLAQPEGK